jgi:hypothetical protein
MELGCGVGLCATAALNAPARTIAAGMSQERISSVCRNHRTRASDLSPGGALPNQQIRILASPSARRIAIAKYRQAWVRLMLTPAPDMASVTWKRAQLKARYHKHTDLKPELIERAIADDVEFLKAHPTRRRRDQEQ